MQLCPFDIKCLCHIFIVHRWALFSWLCNLWEQLMTSIIFIFNIGSFVESRESCSVDQRQQSPYKFTVIRHRKIMKHQKVCMQKIRAELVFNHHYNWAKTTRIQQPGNRNTFPCCKKNLLGRLFGSVQTVCIDHTYASEDATKGIIQTQKNVHHVRKRERGGLDLQSVCRGERSNASIFIRLQMHSFRLL